MNVQRQPADDLPALIGLLWRRRRLIGLAAIVGGVLSLAVSFLVTPSFTTKVSLLPQLQGGQSDVLSQFAGLAGIALGGSSYEELYARIIKSDRVLDEAIARRWRFVGHPDSVLLFSILDIRSRTAEPRQDPRAVDGLKKRLRTEVIEFTREKATGYMELRITVPRDPQLAAALANFLVGRLDAYNRMFRRSKASEQRDFVDKRLREVEHELTAAESALSDFVTRNRAYATSPELVRQYDDLSREASAQATIWTELKRQLEIAKIDEHRELVSVDILDPALPPALRSAPHRSYYLVFGAFLSAIAAMAGILAQHQWRTWRAGGGFEQLPSQ